MLPRLLQIQITIASTLVFTQLFKTTSPITALCVIIITYVVLLKYRKDLAFALLLSLLAFFPKNASQRGDRLDFEIHGRILQGPIFHPDNCHYLIGEEGSGRQWRVSTTECDALPNDHIEAFLRLSKTRDHSALAVDFYILRPSTVSSLHRRVAQQRSRWIKKTKKLEDPSLLIALTTGNKSYISDQRMDFFRDLGISHLLAVSGLHFGVLAAMLWFLFGLLVGPFPSLILRFKKKNLVAPCVLFSLFLFLLFVGAPLSATRAFLMVAAYLVAKLLSRYLRPGIALMYALCAILFHNPENIEKVGFQLSFCALIGILAVLNNRLLFREMSQGSRVRESLILIGAISIAAGVSTLPILLHHSGQISWISFPANLIIVPLFSTFIFPALYLAAFCFRSETILAPLGEFFLNYFSKLSDLFVEQFTFLIMLAPARSFPGQIPAWVSSLIFLITILCLYYLSKFRKSVFLVAIISVLCLVYFFTPAASENLRVHFIDVGQGDATLVQTPTGENILIDTGGSLFGADPGQRAVAPFLKKMGISKLDAILITHDDNDHKGGLEAVKRTIPIARNALGKKRIITHLNQAAYLKKIGFKVFQFQHPEASKNDRSIVTLFRYGKNCVLLSGDIEREAEDHLGAALSNCNVLKLPHHGSKTSSSPEFLSKVNPNIGIVSAGRKNRFGHPHKSVISRLRARSIDILSTQDAGNISMELFTDGKIKIRTRRTGF